MSLTSKLKVTDLSPVLAHFCILSKDLTITKIFTGRLSLEIKVLIRLMIRYPMIISEGMR